MLFCLVGPSAGGKTSMGAYLLERYSETLSRSISVTTRAPRANEVEGEDYYFLSEEQFQQKIQGNEFFEWAKVHGNFYGTLRETVDSTITAGRDLLLAIDLQGIRSFKAAYPEHTVVTFILPPTPGALVERMRARSEISAVEVQKRLETAAEEYAELRALADKGSIEYFIVNDIIDESRRMVSAVYEAEKLRMQRVLPEVVDSICTIESEDSL